MASSAQPLSDRWAGHCWPTDAQRLLLQAALLDGRAGTAALAQWRRQAAVQDLDRASRRLLPLLYLRLRDEAPDDPLLTPCEEEFRRVDARNRELLPLAADAIRHLGTASIDTMLLKGLALVARRLVPCGARSMADCDLLVRPDQALAAGDVLGRIGWTLEGRLDASLLSVRHAVPFRHPSGRSIDLHWHALADCCGHDDDVSFWQAAEPVTLDGASTRTLCHTDLLLHACVHGLRWSIVPTVRWVADACAVLKAPGAAIDWDRLVREAERRVLTLAVVDCLAYLDAHFEAEIPAGVMTTLRGSAVPSWAESEYRLKMQPRSPQRQLMFHWFQHRRLRRSGSVLKDVASLPLYLSRALASRRRLPGVAGIQRH